ncbi:hypothetical protein RND71_028500 [Anisodus tanguticus]|uniref:Uncharacterized protein n=1 Tax=Anisodus tanguticus TaxID=243964 RepID=A0AAE1RLK6_9SOLA|nr:hypothetical protein RND71_028500 [Anisodus tanguticus]
MAQQVYSNSFTRVRPAASASKRQRLPRTSQESDSLHIACARTQGHVARKMIVDKCTP